MIKAILAGAAATEICSVLYHNGNKQIEELLKGLNTWMDENSYNSIAEFKGKMNAEAAASINPFERTQFMKYYSNHE